MHGAMADHKSAVGSLACSVINILVMLTTILGLSERMVKCIFMGMAPCEIIGWQ